MLWYSISLLGGHNKVLQTGRLKQQKVIVSQRWRQEVCDQGVGRVGSSLEASLPGLSMAVLPQCLPRVFCVHLCVQIFFSYKDTSHIVLGSTLIPSF